MRIVLWDLRGSNGRADDGLGQGLRGGLLRWMLARGREPAGLALAYLAALLRPLGHEVEGCDGCMVPGDVHIFHPHPESLTVERTAMARVAREQPRAAVLAIGPLATARPAALSGLGATIVKGEAEQLAWTLDEVLKRPGASVQLGAMEDLRRLPLPDWTPLGPQRYRLTRDFTRFPTGCVESSRGDGAEEEVRHRSVDAVLEEIRLGMKVWGFQSYQFADAVFGSDAGRALELGTRLARLPEKIEFSVRTRPQGMGPEVLRVLRRAGLASVEVETRVGEADRGREADESLERMLAACRGLGIRTTVAWWLGAEAGEEEYRKSLAEALRWEPTWAEFRTVGEPSGPNLAREAASWRAACLGRFYLRWRRLGRHAKRLVPTLARTKGTDPKQAGQAAGAHAHQGPPRPVSGAENLLRSRGLRPDGPHTRPGAIPKDE